MPRIHGACLVAPVLLALIGCGREEPPTRSTQIIVQPPREQLQSPSLVAPGPPPPMQAEMVPPPSPGMGPVVWQPGHLALQRQQLGLAARAVHAATAWPNYLGPGSVGAAADWRLGLGGGPLGLTGLLPSAG